jgi:hypothetical protein
VFSGVALAASEVPVELIERHGLSRREHDRGGEREYQFLLRDRERTLPVWLDGQLQILRWGNQRRQSRRLPVTAWTRRATLEAGGWGAVEVRPVVIPATVGLDRGVWFQVREGVLGVVVADEWGEEVVYVLVEPATHYYQVMTRSEWMPSLVGELI